MPSADLRGFLNVLESTANLLHFQEELSPEYEIPAATKYISHHIGKAVIFDKVKGYHIPVVGNLMGSRELTAIAFGVREDKLEESYLERARKPIKPRLVDIAPVQEVLEESVDILKVIPVLTHHEKDAGAYMSSTITIAKDPETGIRGMGLHRIQVKDKDKIGIFLASPPLSNFLAKAERMNKPLEFAMVSGVDPLTFCASIFFAPEGVDKFEVAGGFAQAPIELVKCRSVDVEVPANAEFVLEGYLMPGVREKEGPFGESSGYYLAYDNPVGKIKLITHRSRPIYHSLTPFSPEEDILLEIMMTPFLQEMVGNALPEVKVKDLSLCGAGEICIVQIEKKTEEDPGKVIDHLLNFFFKVVVVTDDDVNISEFKEIAWAIATRVRPDKDVTIKSDLMGSMIDPSVEGLEKAELALLVGRTAKIGIDATKPLAELEKFERIGVPTEVEKKILKLLEVLK